MRQMERRGNPSGRRSSATFSKNVPTSLPSTRCMSWWILETSKHMRQRRMDCLTGRRQWRGGTVVFNWWGPSKRKRSFFIFRQLKRLAYTGCIPKVSGTLVPPSLKQKRAVNCTLCLANIYNDVSIHSS